VVNAGAPNVQAEVIYCPARYQGDVWKLVFDAETANMITKRLPFHSVVRVAEKVMGEKELEKQIEKEEGRPVRPEKELIPPSSYDPRRQTRLYPRLGVGNLEKEAAAQAGNIYIVDDVSGDTECRISVIHCITVFVLCISVHYRKLPTV